MADNIELYLRDKVENNSNFSYCCLLVTMINMNSDVTEILEYQGTDSYI